MQPLIQIKNVGKDFQTHAGESLTALANVSFDIEAGEFLSLLGPSGSGKSTLLQIIAGLSVADRGTVSFGGKPVTAPPPQMVYLFQQYAKSLLPWRTVEDNVALPLEHRADISAAERRRLCCSYLEKVNLGSFSKHFPWQLSGGMQQRVAIARALAAEPRVLLLDEPFSAVDALTRLALQALVLDLWRQQGLTIFMVTHDVDEAVFMADRIALLSRRPAVLDRMLAPDLPRLRDPILTRELPDFLRIKHELLERPLTKAPAEASQAGVVHA